MYSLFFKVSKKMNDLVPNNDGTVTLRLTVFKKQKKKRILIQD